MADDWLDKTINRIQQHKEDRKRTQDYELLREQKIGRGEHKLFEDLQKELKTQVAALNERLSEKPLGIITSWKSVEITGPREVSLDIQHDSDKHELDLSFYVASSHPQIDELVKIDLNESEEVCFKWQGSCIGAIKLAHALLDLVIDHSLLKS
ncbi:MAG TPA: hypothetical protein VLB46_04565 [Pyrinomonadaceae bacterium]|nr:hypothetical protein [Pyrinomonadaceae bacterium]